MGAKREYQAWFLIGAKLLGSFKTAMTAASARLEGLRRLSLSVGKTITKMTTAFLGLGTAVAAFAATKLLSGIFADSAEEVKKMQQRVQAMIADFMQLDAIRKKGPEYAQKQLDIVMAEAERLGKVSVLRTEIYKTMAATLAAGHVPPRQIKAMLGPMGELLVKSRTVAANEQDAVELANATVKAIHGKTRGMQQFSVFVEAGTGKNKKSLETLYEEILKIERGYAGFIDKAKLTPAGQIQLAKNALADMRKEIGDRLVPLQGRLATGFLAIFPRIKPMLEAGIDWLFDQLNKLLDYLQTPAGQQWLKDFGDTLRRIGDGFAWAVKNAKWLVPTILAVVAAVWALQIAFIAMQAVMAAVAVVSAIIEAPIILVGVAILALVAAVVLIIVFWKQFVQWVDKAWDALGNVPVIGPVLQLMLLPFKQMVHAIDWLVKNWPLLKKVAIDTWEDIKRRFSTAWEFLKNGFTEVGKKILEVLLVPINKVIDGVNHMVDVVNKINPFAKIPHIPRIEMPAGMGAPPAGAGGGGAGAGVGPTAAAVGAATGFGAYGTPMATAGMAGAAGGGMGGGIPVTVASYGGPAEPGQVIGAYGNALGPGDVAISPNLYSRLGAPSPSNYIMVDGERYHVADSSWYHPGEPTSDMVEIWGYGNQIHRRGMAMKAFARGGIATKPTAAMLAETGPEAVLPLAGGRAEGFLRRATRALGMGPLTTVGATHVNFTPNITIHGGASENEQRALESRLRALARDFVEDFKAAQTHERRLSYESGYD